MISFIIPILDWIRATWSTVYYFGVYLQKGGSAMNFVVTIDWKFVVALGVVAIGSIFAAKMDAEAAERVSIHAVDACKELSVVAISD